jgi:molecular chaperone DnaJ
MPKNYYLILGVRSNATPGEIKAAFRQRAKELHPDRSGMGSGPFLEVQEAYGVLGDVAQRRRYDRLIYRERSATRKREGIEPLIPKRPERESMGPLAESPDIFDVSLTSSFERYHPSFAELFERIWSNFEPITRPKAERVESLTVEVTLTPWQARGGGRVRVWVPTRTRCSFCGGRGGIGGYECPRCAGSGAQSGESPVEIDYPPISRDFITQVPLTRFGIHNFYLEHLQKEISEKKQKDLVLLQVISDKVVVAPSRDRA